MSHTLVAFLICALLFALGFSAQAQQRKKVPRIGILSPGADRGSQMPSRAAFEPALRKFGWIPGDNLIIERRNAAGKLDLLPGMAAELVSLPVDIILASSEAIPAAKKATQSIPIVMSFSVDDPVEAGFITNLAHPGANITGLTLQAQEVGGKRLELLKEALPTLSRVAVLSSQGSSGQAKAIETVARALGVRLKTVVTEANKYKEAFLTISKEGFSAVVVVSTSVFFNDRKPIINLALDDRLPLIAPFREYAEDGGLMAYGPNIRELWADRVPIYVDKILKGTKPANLPVEQPTKFELVINLKTAKQIGLTIPPNVLARADKVIK